MARPSRPSSSGWARLSPDNLVAMTGLGMAFADGLDEVTDQEPLESEPSVVILEPSDPDDARCSYERGVQGRGWDAHRPLLQSSNSAMAAGGHTTDKGPCVETERTHGPGLDSHRARPLAGSLRSRLEVRVSAATELHDRAIVGSDNGVTLIGTSVNGDG